MNNVAQELSLLAFTLPTLVACVADPIEDDVVQSDAAAK